MQKPIEIQFATITSHLFSGECLSLIFHGKAVILERFQLLYESRKHLTRPRGLIKVVALSPRYPVAPISLTVVFYPISSFALYPSHMYSHNRYSCRCECYYSGTRYHDNGKDIPVGGGDAEECTEFMCAASLHRPRYVQY